MGHIKNCENCGYQFVTGSEIATYISDAMFEQSCGDAIEDYSDWISNFDLVLKRESITCVDLSALLQTEPDLEPWALPAIAQKYPQWYSLLNQVFAIPSF